MNVAICTKPFQIAISEICVQLNSNSVPQLDFYSSAYLEEKITFLVEHVVFALAAALLFGGILMVSPLSRAGRRASPCGQQRDLALVCGKPATHVFFVRRRSGERKRCLATLPTPDPTLLFFFHTQIFVENGL